jgi:hypothetical protein
MGVRRLAIIRFRFGLSPGRDNSSAPKVILVKRLEKSWRYTAYPAALTFMQRLAGSWYSTFDITEFSHASTSRQALPDTLERTTDYQ